ncbi:MAG: hypothetical protein COA58_13540 [Bacteroidetes bacterium]|nr:MAG: hypothetical protein COA58_13540 [Bacteroidota bacterium]
MNAFQIERLANEIGEEGEYNRILAKHLFQAFTTDQNTIVLSFEPITFKITFFGGLAFFQTPEEDKLQKKNRLSIFKSLVGLYVTDVKTYPYDRRFDIVFSNGDVLAFYLYGKFSQITHYSDGEWQETFPAKSTKIQDYDTTQRDIGDQSLVDLKFLNREQIAFLEGKNFDQQSSESKEILLQELKLDVLSKELFINKGEKKYTLDYQAGEQCVSSFNNAIDALNGFSRLYISHQVFTQTKNSHLGKLKKELSSLKKKEKAGKRNLQELNRAGTYKEKADLLMANLWQLNKGAKKAELTSFDGERTVEIRLQETLTPQANAERYYKKGKNESKQREYAEKQLQVVQQNIALKEEEIEEFGQIESLKQIRKTAEQKSSSQQKRLPYKKQVVDGYEIRIGKGAKDNDELLRNFSNKNDLWLHAKSVSGSHVIICNPSKKNILETTIEKVAQIAAFYSKAKSEGLAAVIYTERKFVRKPKGATPGLVKVDKEDVILVEPRSSFNL